MFKIEDLMSEDFSSYPEDVQEFMKDYNHKLKQAIKDEIVKDTANKMLKDIDNSNETFINILGEILENGFKGLNKMSTRSLVNMYLERKDEESFMRLLEKVNSLIQ
jgi:hypothetical protein